MGKWINKDLEGFIRDRDKPVNNQEDGAPKKGDKDLELSSNHPSDKHAAGSGGEPPVDPVMLFTQARNWSLWRKGFSGEELIFENARLKVLNKKMFTKEEWARATRALKRIKKHGFIVKRDP